MSYKSSERALDHEKFRAIKKKTKPVKQINMSHLSFRSLFGSNSKSHNHF